MVLQFQLIVAIRNQKIVLTKLKLCSVCHYAIISSEW